MLSGNYRENDQAEAKRRGTLNLRVSHTKDLVEKLYTALNFVINKIGFIPEQELTLPVNSGEDITLVDAGGNILIISLQLIEPGTGTNKIIFHTDDCLRDYHKYLMSGVEFISRPAYNETGLQVDFIDHRDNCYTLLEERFYTET